MGNSREYMETKGILQETVGSLGNIEFLSVNKSFCHLSDNIFNVLNVHFNLISNRCKFTAVNDLLYKLKTSRGILTLSDINEFQIYFVLSLNSRQKIQLFTSINKLKINYY